MPLRFEIFSLKLATEGSSMLLVFKLIFKFSSTFTNYKRTLSHYSSKRTLWCCSCHSTLPRKLRNIAEPSAVTNQHSLTAHQAFNEMLLGMVLKGLDCEFHSKIILWKPQAMRRTKLFWVHIFAGKRRLVNNEWSYKLFSSTSML